MYEIAHFSCMRDVLFKLYVNQLVSLNAARPIITVNPAKWQSSFYPIQKNYKQSILDEAGCQSACQLINEIDRHTCRQKGQRENGAILLAETGCRYRLRGKIMH